MRRLVIALTAASLWSSNPAASAAPASVESFERQVSELLEQGRPLAAMEPAMEAVKAQPADSSARYVLGNVLRVQGRLEDAMEEYRKAWRLDPAAWRPRLGIAQCFLAVGRYLEAAEILEALAIEKPQQPSVWIDLAAAYWGLDSDQQAWMAARRALELDPDSYVAWRMMGEIELDLGNVRTAMAIGQRLTLMDPANRLGYLFLARCYAEGTKSPIGAELVLESARKAVPDDDQLFFAFGEMFRERAAEARLGPGYAVSPGPDWRDLAERSYRFAVEADPDDVEYRLELASVLIEKRRFAEAEQQIAAAGKLDPTHPDLAGVSQQLNTARNDLAAAIKLWLQQTLLHLFGHRT